MYFFDPQFFMAEMMPNVLLLGSGASCMADGYCSLGSTADTDDTNDNNWTRK